MLEVYDEHGQLVLGIDDSVTRITGILKNTSINDAFRSISPPTEVERDFIKNGLLQPFILTNILYDLSSRFSGLEVEELSNKRFTQIRHDIVVIGVYSRV